MAAAGSTRMVPVPGLAVAVEVHPGTDPVVVDSVRTSTAPVVAAAVVESSRDASAAEFSGRNTHG